MAVRERFLKIVNATAEAYGCSAEIEYEIGYPVPVNSAEHVVFAADIAREVTPDVNDDTPPLMAGEDFSCMLNARPGAYVFLGAGEGATVHHPQYNFNDDIIPLGCSWLVGMAESRMPSA